MALIEKEFDGAIASLTMNRPDKRNAMSDQFIAELEEAFSTLSESVRVVILTGAGGHFCSGLDLAEHVERSAAQMKVFTTRAIGTVFLS